MRRLLPLLGAGLLIAAACTATSAGSPAPTAAPTAAPSTAPTAAAGYSVATGSNNLILRIATGGGFVAPSYMLTAVPGFALYGDGRIIVPGPVTAIYPGPLLPNLRVITITPTEIQKIVAAADAAGLLGPDASFDTVGIADAGTTVFTTVVDGRAHRISAYALSEAAGAGQPGDQPGGVGRPGGIGNAATPDPEVTAERAKLSQFWAQMTDLATFLGRPVSDAEAYVPTGIRVFVADAAPADASQPTPQTLAWPLASDPAAAAQPTAVEGTTCMALAGADLSTFVAAARQANAATVWTSSGKRYAVSVRPLYPNESGCAGGTL